MSIQGQTLEVRVVGCSRLKDTRWISKQNPFVSIEYGGSRFLSTICRDGGTNPTFQEKNRITLIEGLRELNVTVWGSNTLSYDNLIGSGRVELQKVLSKGFDDTAWPILSKTSRYAGEVCLVMHYSNANNPQPQPQPQYYAAPPPPPPQPQPQYYAAPPQPQPQPQYCAAPPQVPICCGQVPICCAPPPPPAAAPRQPSMYPPQYPPHAYAPQSYPPQPYPPPGYPPSPSHAYPPQN